MFPEDIHALAGQVIAAARAQGLTIVTAESCTGGLVAAALTEIPGASDVVDRGFITYSNGAKHDLLQVSEAVLTRRGAVSEAVAMAMAQNALITSGAGLAVSVTGIAGPGGGSADKPVGLVWFGCAGEEGPVVVKERRFGDIGRSAVRLASVRVALEMLRERLI
jgi:nicotinamide-nucleotide amidase